MNGKVDQMPWILFLSVCLSREVIVLLLLSCCDGINDQDKTIIQLPPLSIHHVIQKRVYCLSKGNHCRHLNLESAKLKTDGEHEKNGLSALFYGNKRV